ncbi:hypothetical protein GYMLUDRAFT_939085 [Collybiopsis luxurians FD-317 M1]|uniref:Uncharacterized protein n=1 Tax=Collybiopsis luxurians FD-317 M1 TaxID=944289 RepID=A0A0D0CEI5_9AGAR|nr:hypothetical protein GYMLUDRAFT_939085 [Collybiopsis luxurians FD-317 M1]
MEIKIRVSPAFHVFSLLLSESELDADDSDFRIGRNLRGGSTQALSLRLHLCSCHCVPNPQPPPSGPIFPTAQSSPSKSSKTMRPALHAKEISDAPILFWVFPFLPILSRSLTLTRSFSLGVGTLTLIRTLTGYLFQVSTSHPLQEPDTLNHPRTISSRRIGRSHLVTIRLVSLPPSRWPQRSSSAAHALCVHPTQ